MYMYTFNPPEEELVSYLNSKITGNDADSEAQRLINEVNICQYEPTDLPGLARIESSHTWHFISPVETFGKLNRRKRATRTGTWKKTGDDSKIKDTAGNPIGVKKYLVFKENKRSSTKENKTSWFIHEYHSSLLHGNKDAYVLCKLMKRARTIRSSATVNVSPAPIDPSPTLALSGSVAIQSQNVNAEDDHGGDFFEGLATAYPDIYGSVYNWHDHSHDLEQRTQVVIGTTLNAWSITGHVYDQNKIDNSNTLEVKMM